MKTRPWSLPLISPSLAPPSFSRELTRISESFNLSWEPRGAAVAIAMGESKKAPRDGDMADDGVGDGFDVLDFINFQWDVVSPKELSGRFIVKPKCSQPFGVLHGGITAFLAEALASLGAQVVSQWARVAGIDLTVSHLQSASIGSEVIAKAVPLRAGKRVQVWDVTFYTSKAKGSSSNEGPELTTIAVARLSVIIGLPDAHDARRCNEKLIAIARRNNVELTPFVSKL